MSDEEESKGESLNQITNVLYEIMGVPKDSKPDEIKKAYKRLALLRHPDKCPDDPKASENFQTLNKAYSILSDPKKRARYDEYGDDGDGDAFRTGEWLDAYDYYRSLHPEISKDDFKSFA